MWDEQTFREACAENRKNSRIRLGRILRKERIKILYTVKEVSEILKTNVDFVHKLRKAGLLPFIKLGSYKVRKEALEEFLHKYEGQDLTDPFNIKGLKNEAV